MFTVYLFCGAYQRYFSIKEIHTFTKEYLLSRFPNLPSYQTFNYRLNLMSEAINELVKHLITFFKPIDCDSMTSVIDSMPIITCAGKCKIGKVAPEIATKGYCSTKNMYYFGLKLHTLAFRREGVIPFPEMIILSLAEENDLTVLKREAANYLINRDILADKIYSDLLLGKRTARTRANYADSRQRQKGRRFYYYSKTESGQRTIFNCGIKGKITDKIFFQLAE